MAILAAPSPALQLRGALRAYGHLIATIEPNWYLVLVLLDRHGALTVPQLAVALQWSLPSIAAVTARMHERGLIDLTAGPRLRLSGPGRGRLASLRHAVDALHAAATRCAHHAAGA